MKIHRVEQGGAEWLALRAGIPTASSFHKIITPKGAPSTQSGPYMHHLLAEWLLGRPILDESESLFMERGSDQEDSAIAYYEMLRNVEVDRVGFVTTDDGRAGCSPDGLIDPSGGLEMKVPAPGTHVGYLLGGMPDKYRWQVIGGLWITGRDWWDFLSYNGEMTPAIVRVERAKVATEIEQLAAAVDRFCVQVAECKAQLLERGFQPKIEPAGALAL